MVEPIACTDREQMLTLYAAPSMNTGDLSLARRNADLTYKEASRPYQVRGRPIDDVVRELNLTRVDAMKVDVEGAEVYVLRGTVKTLKRFHPKVVIEIVAQQLAGMNTTPEELIAQSCGRRATTIAKPSERPTGNGTWKRSGREAATYSYGASCSSVQLSPVEAITECTSCSSSGGALRPSSRLSIS